MCTTPSLDRTTLVCRVTCYAIWWTQIKQPSDEEDLCYRAYWTTKKMINGYHRQSKNLKIQMHKLAASENEVYRRVHPVNHSHLTLFSIIFNVYQTTVQSLPCFLSLPFSLSLFRIKANGLSSSIGWLRALSVNACSRRKQTICFAASRCTGMTRSRSKVLCVCIDKSNVCDCVSIAYMCSFPIQKGRYVSL